MQSDEIIWSVINHEFCSYKTKTIVSNFCKNKYNITGLCSRSSCPLANSRYATILEEDGVCYLYMKTIERAHTPKNMWEKIRLKRSYVKALKQIDSHLEYWPKFLINKAKLRITKIHQYLIRSRRFMTEGENTTIEIIDKRRDKQDGRREYRSLRAIGDIEDNIKKELLERLKKGVYEDIYNFSQANFEAALDEQKEQDGMEDDEEYVEDYDDDEEEEDEEEDEEEEDGEEDIEDTTGELEYEFDEGEDEFEDLLKGGEDEDDEVDLAGDSDDEDDDEEDIQRFTTPVTVKTVSALKKRAKPTGGKPSVLPPPAKKARANVVIQYENETESSSSRARETN